MADGARRVLFVFLDGVGLGDADPAINALADRGLSRLMREDWPRTLDDLERRRRGG